jgi:hypothetical protein
MNICSLHECFLSQVQSPFAAMDVVNTCRCCCLPDYFDYDRMPATGYDE